MQRRHQFVAGAFLLAALCAAAWYLYARGSAVPRITRDYLAEINAPLEDMPDDQRAWPRYRAAMQRIGSDLNDSEILYAEPGTPEWSRFAAAVERHQDALAEIREAAKLPYLGYRYGYIADPEFATAGASIPTEDPTGLEWTVLTTSDMLPRAGAFLARDARLAIERGNGERVAEDVIAIASIVRHLRETPFSIENSIGVRLLLEAISLFGAALEADASMFTEEQMAAILRALSAAAALDFRSAIAVEQIVADDYEQRNFTDGGRGDGYYYGPPDASWHGSIFDQLGVLRNGRVVRRDKITRREFREKVRELREVALKELAQPLWSITVFTSDRELSRLGSDPRWEPLRFYLLAPFYYIDQMALMNIDALRVAVAIELYWRQHATFPSDLEQLVPEFLDEVPLDRHDGLPLRYRVVAGRPLVYSVGLDRIDDLGAPLPIPALSAVIGRGWVIDLGETRRVPRGDVILWPPSLAEYPADFDFDADAESDQQIEADSPSAAHERRP